MGWLEDTLDVGANVMTMGAYGLVKDGQLGGNTLNNGLTGGSNSNIALSGSNGAARAADMAAGRARGQEIFYDDPDMKMLRQKREDLAKGYSGEELGALRQTARGEIAGQRSNYLRSMHSNLAKGGVGGARGAAIRGAADQKFAQTGADAERKMALDSGNMVRQGTNDLQDYIFRQKYGGLGTELGYAQLGTADRSAAAAAAANNKENKGFLSGLFG